SSMLWLWCFGYILQDLAGNNKLIPIYIYGGITGSVFFVLMNNMVPVLANQVGTAAPLLGAGSAVMAIAVATTTLAPDYRIFPLINGG
ncbi:rhomboid family intramembrane serine protease, partial [Salmonella enterica]|uniref:rhomboid family intramembrane serine protease n=2 Tax=Pseudomonadati TaxID=3379134 RepID=UPI0022B67D0C